MPDLSGATLFISGASRGIGLAIALRAARDGANVALIAKTAAPHPKLEGTIYTAAEQIEAAGGQALPAGGATAPLTPKTAEPHPKLEGTISTAAEQIEAAGGQALPVVGDIRDEAQVNAAVEQAVERFGGIDICVNNASAINL